MRCRELARTMSPPALLEADPRGELIAASAD